MSFDIQRKCAECHKELKDNQGHPEPVSIPATSSFPMPSGGVLLYCDECFTLKKQDGIFKKAASYDSFMVDEIANNFSKKCLICNSEFSPKNDRHLYCTLQCSGMALKIRRIMSNRKTDFNDAKNALKQDIESSSSKKCIDCNKNLVLKMSGVRCRECAKVKNMELTQKEELTSDLKHKCITCRRKLCYPYTTGSRKRFCKECYIKREKLIRKGYNEYYRKKPGVMAKLREHARKYRKRKRE